MNYIVFQCHYCGCENEVEEYDFEGEEECEECGAINYVEIEDEEEDY